MDKRIVVCPNCGASGKVDVEGYETETINLRCPKCARTFSYVKEHRMAPRTPPLPNVKMGPFGFESGEMKRKGTLMDLSITGMRVRVHSSPPKMNERLSFKFSLPGSSEEAKGGGEVIWVRQMEDGGYEFGMEFVALDQHNRKIIGFFLFPEDEEEVLEMEYETE